MLAGMSASEFTTLDLIVKRHEEELIEDALADLPEFILERQPRVMLENNGLALGRWLMFGRPPQRRVARAELGLVLRPDGAVR